MTYDTVIVCVCGASLHDNAAAREGHEDFWHSDKHPAEYTNPNAMPLCGQGRGQWTDE